MSDGTAIQWTDASWNPLRAHAFGKTGWACVRVSQGCVNCYAATINKRLGTGLDYTVPALAQVTAYLDKKALELPTHWKKPRRIFVCSMTDLFGEWVTDEQIGEVFDVMARTPRHTFQVLTKRPKRMREYVERWVESHTDEYRVGLMPHVWLGTSVENQATADERIPHLLSTPAAVRFLSCEPMLGPVALTGLLEKAHRAWVDAAEPYCAKCRRVLETPTQRGVIECAVCHETAAVLFPNDRHSIDWVIVGGESGAKARPMDLAWARSLVRQAQLACTSVFVKQLGARPRRWLDAGPDDPFRLRDSHGGDPAEWPEDLRVREWPQESAVLA